MKDIDIVLKKISLLIIEDDLVSGLLFQELFTKRVKEIFSAKNANEALGILKNNPNIDLILLDLRLPDINGLELVPILRKIAPNSVIIAQTAYAHDKDRNTVINAGCHDYITKPVRSSDLFNLILKHF